MEHKRTGYSQELIQRYIDNHVHLGKVSRKFGQKVKNNWVNLFETIKKKKKTAPGKSKHRTAGKESPGIPKNGLFWKQLDPVLSYPVPQDPTEDQSGGGVFTVLIAQDNVIYKIYPRYPGHI